MLSPYLGLAAFWTPAHCLPLLGILQQASPGSCSNFISPLQQQPPVFCHNPGFCDELAFLEIKILEVENKNSLQSILKNIETDHNNLTWKHYLSRTCNMPGMMYFTQIISFNSQKFIFLSLLVFLSFFFFILSFYFPFLFCFAFALETVSLGGQELTM